MAEVGCLKDGAFQNGNFEGKVDVTGDSIESGITYRRTINQVLFNTGADVTSTLTRAQSGTLFLIDGTGDIVVNLPALSTSNVGIEYEFLVTTAVGGAKTVAFTLPGSGVSNFFGNLTSQNASHTLTTIDVAGNVLTLATGTVKNSYVKLVCVNDDETKSTWYATFWGTPVATIT